MLVNIERKLHRSLNFSDKINIQSRGYKYNAKTEGHVLWEKQEKFFGIYMISTSKC